jgi:hypothetical protein
VSEQVRMFEIEQAVSNGLLRRAPKEIAQYVILECMKRLEEEVSEQGYMWVPDLVQYEDRRIEEFDATVFHLSIETIKIEAKVV